MSDVHGKIIAAAAKAELAALGFRRQGRSLLWLADRGSWLNVVEFTPSRWSKSVSLVNAAHWLWVGAGFMSFNYSLPSNIHVEFETEDQFGSDVADVANMARAKAMEIDEKFHSFDAIVDFVVERARTSPDRLGPSWSGYEAGIASGLTGRIANARHFLHNLTDERVTQRAAPLLPLIERPEAFRSKVNDHVAQERARLKLPTMGSPPF